MAKKMTQFQRSAQKLVLKQEFATRLEAALDSRNYPPHGRQVMLANQMDLSQTSIRKWLVGETMPSQEKQKELAALLDVNLSWLSNGKGVMSGNESIHTGIPILKSSQIVQWLSSPENTIEQCETIAMANPNHSLFAIRQAGDAMATTKLNSIPDGALLVIDTQDKIIESSERYLIAFSHLKAPTCREAIINEQGEIAFICSNPNEHTRETFKPKVDILYGRVKHVVL